MVGLGNCRVVNRYTYISLEHTDRVVCIAKYVGGLLIRKNKQVRLLVSQYDPEQRQIVSSTDIQTYNKVAAKERWVWENNRLP